MNKRKLADAILCAMKIERENIKKNKMETTNGKEVPDQSNFETEEDFFAACKKRYGKEQEVDEAAEKFADDNYPTGYTQSGNGFRHEAAINAFIAGAEWKAAQSHPTTTVLEQEVEKNFEEILARHSKNYAKWDKSEKSLFFLQVNGHEAINAMKEAAVKPSTVLGWVDVQTDLPPKDNDVWEDSVSCIVCDLSEGSYNENRTATAWYNYERKEWYVLHFNTSSEPIKVTHWMPLPSAPNKSNSTPTPTNETEKTK